MRFRVSGFRLHVVAVLGLCLCSFVLSAAADNADDVIARPHGVAVAGFGNSYHTDGPFLRYIATQPSLPGGIRATSVMINGGQSRPGYTEHFKTIDEKDVVGQ